ncbi:MAG TPA: hypothetical protein VNR11_00080 [Xanthobacteraceae bacterium]|nr:hypothetical protein [Xanthobacteraceae bacterium]
MTGRLVGLIALAALGLALAGCSFGRVSGAGTGSPVPVRTIAMLPGGGLLQDSVALELANRGFTIIDSAATASLMPRAKVRHAEDLDAGAFTRLRERGVDAVWSCRPRATATVRPRA